MQANILRQESKESLEKMLDSLEKKLREFRFQLISGKVKNIREIRVVRRDIAKVHTILNEKK